MHPQELVFCSNFIASTKLCDDDTTILMQGWGFLDISPLKASVIPADCAHHAIMMMMRPHLANLSLFCLLSIVESVLCPDVF